MASCGRGDGQDGPMTAKVESTPTLTPFYVPLAGLPIDVPPPTASPTPTVTPTPPALDEPQPRAAGTAPVAPGNVLAVYAQLIRDTEARYGLPAGTFDVLAILESSAGIHACGYNLTGYASCRVTFASYEEGIEVTLRTFASYGGDIWYKACVWNAGAAGCAAGRGHTYADTVVRMLNAR